MLLHDIRHVGFDSDAVDIVRYSSQFRQSSTAHYASFNVPGTPYGRRRFPSRHTVSMFSYDVETAHVAAWFAAYRRHATLTA